MFQFPFQRAATTRSRPERRADRRRLQRHATAAAATADRPAAAHVPLRRALCLCSDADVDRDGILLADEDGGTAVAASAGLLKQWRLEVGKYKYLFKYIILNIIQIS